ncbi:MAG TPA: hypothetical protein VMU27_03445 [Candidatus Paceibacterota bacterium]|nr:hypothetical protein [Candidatus Paceibacterota bacterium]
MATQENIVQAEFFHVGGGDTPSLEALFDQCRERVKEGLELELRGVESRSRIKTVVRFFDESGKLTKLAFKAERLHKKDNQVLQAFLKAKGLRRWWLNHQSRRLAGQTLALKEEARLLAAEHLRLAIRKSRDVAVEHSDHSFRLARKDETHELVESAYRSTGVWLFVFRPNHLLSDTNASVACAM